MKPVNKVWRQKKTQFQKTIQKIDLNKSVQTTHSNDIKKNGLDELSNAAEIASNPVMNPITTPLELNDSCMNSINNDIDFELVSIHGFTDTFKSLSYDPSFTRIFLLKKNNKI
jgi:hypothetical protein